MKKIMMTAVALLPVLAIATQPNIVLVLADDVGPGDLRCYAPGVVPTPNLDRLAQQGVRFTQARSACALCAPTRYSILSGNNSWRGRREYGTWNWWRNSQFVDGQRSVAQLLQSLGYHCAAYGKWNIGARFRDPQTGGFVDEQTPHWAARDRITFEDRLINGPGDMGFETSYISLEGIQGPPYAFFRNDRLVGSRSEMIHFETNIDYPEMIDFNPADYPAALIDKGKAGLGMPDWDTAAVAGILLKEAQAFITEQSKKEQPFFIYYAAVQAHCPWTVPDTYLGKQLRDTIGGPNYLEMVAQLDMDIGALLHTLEESGELDNTLFVFTSDNGGLPFAGRTTLGHDSVMGLRASKAYIYEGGLAIPLILSWPASALVGKGSVCNAVVITQDLAPTLVDLAGGTVPPGQALDGVSIAKVLSDTTSKLTRTQPVIFQSGPPDKNRYALREGDWKLVCSARKNGLASQELYNLTSDPLEQNNLIDHPEQKPRADSMHQALVAALKEQCFEN